ncbi:phosphonate C-P lyase system protein PhnH [Acidovorax sp. NCPPB 2350]|nr:phosphonate C-P lyase system protein PhnH [Acidovorax sp. NCPPB 2350]
MTPPPVALDTLRPGFQDAALGSQAVFRIALAALSHPGRPLPIPRVAEVPETGHPAAAALMLALLDADCALWLSPRIARGDAGDWLRFHTGCRLAGSPGMADFLWIGLGDPLPPLAGLRLGSDTYPEESATCVVEVEALHAPEAGPGWWLSGPGVAGRQGLDVQGGPPTLAALQAESHALFPRGVDLFLATPDQIAGLPRTTHIEHSRER